MPDDTGLTYFLRTELSRLNEEGLLRSPGVFPGTGGYFITGGKQYLNFSSNDYLDLSRHPIVKESAVKAIEKWGTGATASRLMCGTTDLHTELEEGLALIMGTESTLVFGSGFLTNLGIITTFASDEDFIFADKLNHASLIDGMRLCRAPWQRFRHKDMNHLEKLLQRKSCKGRRFIVSDSIFSMDGDITDLKTLTFLAEKYDALLIIDEAHAIGVFGEKGGGVLQAKQLDKPFCISATLSKAFGGYGGFIACRKEVRKYLLNKARSFIYSTGLPPGSLGSAIGVLKVLEQEPDLGKRLLRRVKFFHDCLVKQGLTVSPFESHILTIITGENKSALQFSARLAEKGIYAAAVRPPTVPAGTARLRLSVTLAHTVEQLQYTAGLIKEAAEEYKIL